MAEWKIPIGVDPLTGAKSEILKEDGQTYIHHEYPNDALIAENKRLNTQPQKGRGGVIGARIPQGLYYDIWPREFEAKYGAHPHRAVKDRKVVREYWARFVKAKLNSPEYRYLRTNDGKKL